MTSPNPEAAHLTALGGPNPKQAPADPAELLEFFDSPGADFVDRFETREFTCNCPKTGQPDFATIRIWYRPALGGKCVELKSLKLYIWGFRNQGIFHEYLTQKIVNDLCAKMTPQWLLVESEFEVRGGVYTSVFASRGPVPSDLMVARMAEPRVGASSR